MESAKEFRRESSKNDVPCLLDASSSLGLAAEGKRWTSSSGKAQAWPFVGSGALAIAPKAGPVINGAVRELKGASGNR